MVPANQSYSLWLLLTCVFLSSDFRFTFTTSISMISHRGTKQILCFLKQY